MLNRQHNMGPLCNRSTSGHRTTIRAESAPISGLSRSVPASGKLVSTLTGQSPRSAENPPRISANRRSAIARCAGRCRQSTRSGKISASHSAIDMESHGCRQL
jgi:hypothetical protein